MTRSPIAAILALYGVLSMGSTVASPATAQDRYAEHRATLSKYVGQDVLILDTTSGSSQFQNADALQTLRLKLNSVYGDYIVVSRNVEGDRRDFVYPLAVIRRIRTVSEGRPLRPIVIELY